MVAYTMTDHLGSPRIITDQYGQVKSRRDFMPFGEDIFQNVGASRTASLGYSTSQDDLRQKFTGYQKDSETQLDFAEARMYENRFGRFTAVDPLLASGKSANPQTFNRYAYTSNNPIDRVDANGKDWTRVKNTRIIGTRVYTTWIPVWKDNAVGSTAWKSMVYRIQYGKDRGKWAALDPWNNRWTLADTRAGAIAAYEGYRNQMKTDAIAGAQQPAVETVNAAEVMATKGASLTNGQGGIGTRIRDAAFTAAGARVDESSGPFNSANNLSSTLSTAGSGLGVGQVAARIAAGPIQRTVLGKFPTYLREAERIGGNALDIRKEVWDSMTPAEQWRMNTQFLDEAINRGDDFVLASDPAQATGYYLRELEYLRNRGYMPSADGTRLIRGQ